MKLHTSHLERKVKLISNQSGVIAGLEFAKQTFKLIDKKKWVKISKSEK